MPVLKISIVNVVATAPLDRRVNLESFKESFPHEVIHDPEIYGGRTAYFKSNKMQGKVLIFPSGKMISVGTKSPERAKQELVWVASRLGKKRIAKLKGQATIQNMVATSDLGFEPKLESVERVEGFQIIYNPNSFQPQSSGLLSLRNRKQRSYSSLLEKLCAPD